MALHIKKGDMVQIVSGDHKGATGRILRVDPENRVVIIQGQNIAKKHVRPSQRSPQGGRIGVEQPIHISNVLPVNPKTSQGTRVRYPQAENGGKKRVAVDGTELGTVRKARS